MSSNIFDSISVNSPEEIFTTLVKDQNIHIERIVSNGHVTEAGHWYDQSENEWVIVIKGEAKLEFIDGKIEKLKLGDYIHIPAHQKHRVIWTKENIETIWLAVHY